ncbi:MAG: prolipoprotein diacylglyceryl transferase [Eubacteriaceae bacterium]|nr:prolipoprotein diacylglyceryl transferase [Eubacteriaceae bacterium]
MPDPIAFNFFGIAVRWYGLLISLAMLLGIFFAIKRGSKKGIVSDDILDIVLVTIPSAIIGARLYYVLFQLDYYLMYPGKILRIWEGGLAIHGGLIAAFVAGYIVVRIKKLDFLTLADIFAPCFPLGQAIGRWGNYFNQEAYGTETNLPWAITVLDPVKGLIQVHPTFLYESIWNILVLFIVLAYEKKAKKNEGELIFIYGIFYSVGRFMIEGLRTDSLMFFGLRIAQLISVAILLFCSFYLYKTRKK